MVTSPRGNTTEAVKNDVRFRIWSRWDDWACDSTVSTSVINIVVVILRPPNAEDGLTAGR
jgi:hypothetical protein